MKRSSGSANAHKHLFISMNRWPPAFPGASPALPCLALTVTRMFAQAKMPGASSPISLPPSSSVNRLF